MSDREFLIEANTQDVLKLLIADCELSIPEAMRRFYHSDTYKRLADETTKLWHYGPVALYQEFTDELKQNEPE